MMLGSNFTVVKLNGGVLCCAEPTVTLPRMKKVRDSQRTKKRILDAATREFTRRGFDGARIAEIARRSNTSKQLIHHHFHGKEALFMAVHDANFRPSVQWQQTPPGNPVDAIAERFRQRVKDIDYSRFLTWEAASTRSRRVPGERERQQRITEYGEAIRAMQRDGKFPADLDHRLIQLAILALATYPVAFAQITRLVTGRMPTDPLFQREWTAFLRKIGVRMFGSGTSPPTRKS